MYVLIPSAISLTNTNSSFLCEREDSPGPIFMASQSGLAGSVTVEDDVELAGGAQVANHLTLGKGARIAAKAGVTKSIPAGLTVSGFPAEEITVWRRSMVRLRQMGKK